MQGATLIAPCRTRLVLIDVAYRSTTKFCEGPRDVLRVKAAIVRHLPVLIFGRR